MLTASMKLSDWRCVWQNVSYVVDSHGKTSIPGWVFNSQGMGGSTNVLPKTKRLKTKRLKTKETETWKYLNPLLIYSTYII